MLVTSGIEAWNHPVLGTYNGSEPQSCWRERELGIVSPDNGNLICAASISDGLWPRTTFLGQPSLSFGQKSHPFHLFSMVFGENPISPMLSLVFPWFFYGFPSGNRLQFAIGNGPFIVDVPIKDGDFP